MVFYNWWENNNLVVFVLEGTKEIETLELHSICKVLTVLTAY